MKCCKKLMAVSIVSLLFGATLQAQEVTLSYKKAPIEKVINVIEKQTDYKFLYNKNVVNVSQEVTISVQKKGLKAALDELFKSTGITYTIEGKQIVLSIGGSKKSTTTKKITGVVVDANGEPLIGASVSVEGTGQGTITDMDGAFSMEVSEGARLNIGFIGYNPVNLVVDNRNSYNLKLVEDSKLLDEVVVVGYGTMKKRDLTGAVSSVKFSDAPIQTVATASHALAGKAAGLKVSQTSAQVGGGASFRIRGEASTGAGNDPLIVIDGFPVSVGESLKSGTRYEAGTTDNILESINPNDIESIEILKDASSTAIYGARAGHGVILITTKRGSEGKVTVNYSGSVSSQSMKNPFKMLDGKDFMLQSNRFFKEIWMKENGQGIYADYITPNPNPKELTLPYTSQQIDNAQTTPWFDLVTRKGFMTQHSVSMTGGSKTTKYLASLNYMKQNGVLKKNDMERMTMKLNLDQQISERVKAGISLNLSRNSYDNVPLGKNRFENAGLIVSAINFDPTLPVYNEDGTYTINPREPNVPNPVSLLDITDKTVKDRLLGSAFIEAEVLKGLKLKANFGLDRRYEKRSNYLPKGTKWGGSANGKANIKQYDNNDYLMELTATYNRQFGIHNLTALAGYSFQKFTGEGVEAGNEDFIIDSFEYNNLGAGNASKPSVGSSASTNSMGSYFARVNYSLLDRYLLTATVRADGASNLAKGNQWGYFPSVSGAWRFSDEAFVKSWSENFLSNGKLRLSWGQTGNSNIGNRALNLYGAGYTTMFGNETAYPGVYTSQLSNPNLTWETTTEMNIGLDLGFLKDRINLTVEYFDRTISDLLVKEKALLSYNELTTIAANIGKTQSRGLELTLNTKNFVGSKFTWSTDVTFSTYLDRWKERDPDWTGSSYEKVDDPIRPIHTYRADGMLKVGEKAPAHQPLLLPGQIKLKDLNNDGKLNNEDKELIGSKDPAFYFGLNNMFTYKKFDLNIYFYGEVNKLMGASYYDDASIATAISIGENVSSGLKEGFASDNLDTKRPSIIGLGEDGGDYFYKNISYLRCRNITLGYTIPVKKTILNRLRVYADINNPFVITNWTGQDPETDDSAWAYPNVISMSFGVDVTF